MTMKFIKSADFYNSNIDVRAYVQLKNGTYVYSDVRRFTVYYLADYLYQNDLMSNENWHDYLYENVLTIANPHYVFKQYDCGQSLIKP